MDRIPCNRYVAFVGVAIVGLTADLATKAYMFSWPKLLAGQTHWIWPRHAGFQLSLNEGALFGMGQGMAPLLAALGIAAAIAIPVWLFWFGTARDLWLTVALASVTAGVLGNLYDRLGLPGLVWPSPGPRAGEHVYAVRDWILLQLNDQWIWPNFNIADALLNIGAAILLIRAVTQSNSADDKLPPTGQ